MIDLSTSTMEALQAEFVRLAVLLVDLENQRTAIELEMEARKRRANVKARVDAMSEVEKDAMRQVLHVPADAKA